MSRINVLAQRRTASGFRWVGAGRATVITFVAAATVAAGLPAAAQARTAGAINLQYAAQDLAKSYGAATGYSTWDPATRSIIGENTSLYQATRGGSNSGQAANYDVKTLEVAVTEATGYDPAEPSGAAAINAMVTSLDQNLGTFHSRTFASLQQAAYRLQPTEVGPNDELRRKLLYTCATCVKAAVTTAAGVGVVLTGVAISGVQLSAIAHAGIIAAVAAVILVAVLAVEQWSSLDMNRQSARFRGIVQSFSTTIVSYLVGALQGHTNDIHNLRQENAALRTDLEAQTVRLGEFQTRMRTLEEQHIHRAGRGFFGRLWGN